MLVFFVVEREEKGKKNDNWNFWIWGFLSKNGRFLTHICFSKCLAETPIFIVFFWCACFGQVVKKRNLGHPPKTKEKFWLITEFGFWGTLCFLLFFLSFFWGGGGCFFVLFFCVCFLEGLRVTWPSLLLLETKPVFPFRKKKRFLFIFEWFPLFLLGLFWPPPFSISRFLSLSCFFLLVFLLIFCFLWFLLVLFSLLLFHERNSIKRFNCNFLDQFLIFLWFPVLFFLSNLFS